MNKFKNENSSSNTLSINNQINSKNISFFNLKLGHRFFDSINISLLILIFILSFLSFDSQRKWTTIYNNLAKTRSNNSNLIDYISKTEEFYINEIDTLKTLKKTTPKDLIYLNKQISKKKKNILNKNIQYVKEGLKDSKFQRGY